MKELLFGAVMIDAGKDVFNQRVEVGRAKELHAGFALGTPQVTRGIDDAVACAKVSSRWWEHTVGTRTKQLPRSLLKEVTLGDGRLVLQHELEILGAVDNHSRR